MRIRRAFLITVAALAALPATLAFAQSPVAGSWTLSVDSPQGTTQATLVLAVDGTALKGSIRSDMGEAPISGGTVSGADVRFQFDYAGPSGSITIITTGTVAGDEIKGAMDYGQGTAPFTGKRAAK